MQVPLTRTANEFPWMLSPATRFLPESELANLQVLLPAYGGNSIKVGDEEYTLYKTSEILAIINEAS